MTVPAQKRNAGGKNRLIHLRATGDSHAPVVEKSALAFFRPEHLFVDRFINNPGGNLAIFFERDRHGKMRDAMDEICRAIDRVDDPAAVRIIAGNLAIFFHQKAIIVPRVFKLFFKHFFGADIGGGDKVSWPFAGYLQLINFTVIAF